MQPNDDNPDETYLTDWVTNRRTVMKTSGLALMSFFAPGVASAHSNGSGSRDQGRSDGASQQGPPEHARGVSWLRVDGTRVELVVSRDEWANADPAAHKGIPAHARPIPFVALEKQVTAINEALADGDLLLKNTRGRPVLQRSGGGTPTPKVDTADDDTVTTVTNLTCNKSGHKVHDNLTHTKYVVWLSDDNINDMNALFDMGTGVSAFADVLVRWGVLESSTPPGTALLIAVALWLEKGLINWYNDGCGVKITIYIPVTGGPVFQTVSSQ